MLSNAAPQPVRALKNGVTLRLTKDEDLHTVPDQLHGLLVLGDGRAYEIRATPGALASSSLIQSSGAMLRIVLLAFVGGVILNLMPCVFPVLFIKGLALVQSSAEERRKLRLHGLVYTLGILASFWLVVGVLLALRGAGHNLGWGFQFQSPTFVALIALLLFFLGLSLAGQFEIGLTLTSAGSGLAAKSGYAGSFFTGVLAVIVATPCTAPFMGAAIGYALSNSALVSFAVFTALALGSGCALSAAGLQSGMDAPAASPRRLDGNSEAGRIDSDLRDGDLAGLGLHADRQAPTPWSICLLRFFCWRLPAGFWAAGRQRPGRRRRLCWFCCWRLHCRPRPVRRVAPAQI